MARYNAVSRAGQGYGKGCLPHDLASFTEVFIPDLAQFWPSDEGRWQLYGNEMDDQGYAGKLEFVKLTAQC